MRPIEEFVYVGNQVIVPDQASLMRCYYPIIGGEGYALYQYFVAFYDNGNHRHKFAAILNHLNFGMQPLHAGSHHDACRRRAGHRRWPYRYGHRLGRPVDQHDPALLGAARSGYRQAVRS